MVGSYNSSLLYQESIFKFKKVKSTSAVVCYYRAEPLYIYDDDCQKKKVRASTEEVKHSTGKKPALKKAKEVEAVLRISLGLQALEDARRESQEHNSVLTYIKTYSESESPGESGEASQIILNSVGGLLSNSLKPWQTLLSLPQEWF
jgi:hypothetical protein